MKLSGHRLAEVGLIANHGVQVDLFQHDRYLVEHPSVSGGEQHPHRRVHATPELRSLEQALRRTGELPPVVWIVRVQLTGLGIPGLQRRRLLECRLP